MNVKNLTHAVAFSHKLLLEARQELSNIEHERFDSTGEVETLYRTLNLLIESMDVLIRSGHFIEPEPQEGGHKI